MKKQNLPLYFVICLLSISGLANGQAPAITIKCNGPIFNDCNARPGTPHAYSMEMTNFPSCNDGSSCKFKWEVTNGIIAGGSMQGSTSVLEGDAANGITVVWNNVSGNGTVKVSSSVPASTTNGCPSCPTLSATKTLPIKNLGTAGTIKVNGVAISGSYTVSCGNTPMTLSVDPVANATTYSWSLPGGWSGAANSNTITVTPSTNTQGTIKVTASRSDNTYLSSASPVINVSRPLPVLSSITPAPGNPLSLCTSSQTVTASATGVNADKFVWIPTGGARINGASTQQVVVGSVNISAASSDGSYTVSAYSTACAVASTNNLSKTVWYGPATMNSGTYETNGLTYGLVEEGGGTPNPNALCYTGPSYGGVIKVNYSRVLTRTWARDYSVPANVPWSQNQYGGVDITFQAANQEILFELSFGNNCNSTSKYFGFRSVNCFQALTVFPNPSAQDVITVQLDNVENEEVIPAQIALFSEKSTEPVRTVAAADFFKRKAFKDNNKIEINVKDLPRGNYYLHVKHAKIVNKATEKIRVILD
jgi:hypothetical protein